jgi:hypothetical protein
MKFRISKPLKLLLISGLVMAGLFAMAFYFFLQIDFIGEKDPAIQEANRQRWKNMLLSAEYRNGTDYCVVEVEDSVNMFISAGDKAGGIMLTPKYRVSGDTIIMAEGTTLHAGKHLNSDRLLVKGDKLLYLTDRNGNFDSSRVMKVKFNKLNQ